MAFIGNIARGNNYDCEIEFDGASKGNPGMSGAGAILRDRRNNTTWHLSKGLGFATCNVAEYHGLILGMRAALEKGYRRVHVSGDSSLVCNQVDGRWRVSNPNLKILYEEVQGLRNQFALFAINCVPRENNGDADYEANTGCSLPDGCVNSYKRRV